jgi:hypothetical protein
VWAWVSANTDARSYHGGGLRHLAADAHRHGAVSVQLALELRQITVRDVELVGNRQGGRVHRERLQALPMPGVPAG